ncbi:hypothetical protein [Euzebyella saccharophila]|uniref:Uncharacterized protein n=1 Tax=Euzebyella saccharophila TaxID=679664 RepID=A0ABV8JPV3_9FLAO|nr:hypothetical protein [Euzebyella saccharophila]
MAGLFAKRYVDVDAAHVLFGCSLLLARCSLLVVGCWLLVVGCWLLVVGCWLLVVGKENNQYLISQYESQLLTIIF